MLFVLIWNVHFDILFFPPAKCSIPTRFVFVLMSFLGFNMLYALRVNLSVAIVPMVRQDIVNDTDTNQTSTDTVGEFHWNERTQGLILSSFFVGYVITQLPGGRLADLFGSKWLFGGGILATSLLTIASPLAARTHYILFIICRALQGVFQVCFSFPVYGTFHYTLELPKTFFPLEGFGISIDALDDTEMVTHGRTKHDVCSDLLWLSNWHCNYHATFCITQ